MTTAIKNVTFLFNNLRAGGTLAAISHVEFNETTLEGGVEMTCT
jgi:hypothetical protein